MNTQELENLLEEALQSVQQNIPTMAHTFRQHGIGALATPTTRLSTLHVHQDISGNSLTDVITDISANPALIPTPHTEHTSTSTSSTAHIPEPAVASSDNHTDDVTMIQYAAINSFFEYQENIRMYQQNVRSFLRVVDTMVSGNTTRRTSTPRFLRRPTSFPSFVTNLPERLFQQGSGVGAGMGTGSGQNLLSFEFQTRPFLFSPPEVPPIPTLEQYTQSTEVLVFNSSNVSQLRSLTCPITLEEFQHGELLCRIKHCNHIFKEAALRNWFLQNSHCPVCRHDIRENPLSNTPTTG